MAMLNFSVLRLPKSLFYLVFITLLLSTILPGDILAASKKPGIATEAADSFSHAVVAYVAAAAGLGRGADTDLFTTIAVESERTRLSAVKPDPAVAVRRVSQTSVIVDQWPTEVTQGETLMGEFRGSNTGTASGGPFPVTQFKIKVTIPTQLTLTSQTSTMGTWTIENQVATLDVGNFAAGAEFSFTMDFVATGSGDVTLQIKVEQFDFHPGPETFNCPVQITVTPIAYVDASAAGPGAVGNINMPYPGLLKALEELRFVLADDKRICIVPASYPGMAVFDFEVQMSTWNGETGASMELDVQGAVSLPDGVEVNVDTAGDVNLGTPGLLDPEDGEFHIGTSLEVNGGTLVTNGILRFGNEMEVRIGDGELKTAGTGGFDFPTEWIPTAPPDGLDRPFDVNDDGIDLLYFGTTDRSVGLEWPSVDTSPPTDREDVIRDLNINPGDPGDDIIISLRDEEDRFRINGDVIIGGNGRGQASAGGSNVGSLDIGNSTLEINSTNGNDTVLDIHSDADFTSSGGGRLRFTGNDDTAVWVETDVGRLRIDFPAIEVDRADSGGVTFDAEGVLSDAAAGMPANNPDIIRTSHFRLTLGKVELLDGLDIFDVDGEYDQFAGEFRMNGVSSIGPDPTRNYVQTVRVGFFVPGKMIIEDGEFYASDGEVDSRGGNVDVFGDFCLGCTPPGSGKKAQLGDALFDLRTNGTQTVVGNFTVGPDTNPDSDDPEDRNRYFLGGDGSDPEAGLYVGGDFHFEGTGDRFDDNTWFHSEQGLQGSIFFTGVNEQNVFQRQDEDAFFNDVTITGNGGIQLETHVWQNDTGTLTLENGIIDVGADSSDWIILNPGFEEDLVDRNNSARGEGVVDLGSRDSYINGGVQRVVEHGNAGGGVVTGGYLFPVGCQGESSTGNCNDPVGAHDVDFFRPLILQFPDDLSRSTLARVDYRQDIQREDVEFPNDGLVVLAVGGGTLTLDVLSDQFWQLEFDQIPSFDPNIRVEADGLSNIFDIKSLRLIQWNCDGTDPRVAGQYDLDGEPGEPGDALLNDFINGVPNLTQEGVDVNECNIIGIASNFLINPIGPEPGISNPLTLTKEFTDDPVPPGGTVTLEFTIGHDGSTDSSATGIAFTDDLGLALSGLEAAGLPANDVCGTGSQLSGTSTLTLSGGSLAPSSTCTFSVTLNVPAAAPADNYPNITSEITSTVNNMAVTGGPASDILQVSGPPQADFSITKTADNPNVALDSLITFTITVTNNGPEPGSAMVTDNLPTNVDFVTAMGDCTELNGVVTCNTSVLAVGTSESFTITVQAKDKSASSNTATVSALPPVEDLNSSNNTASVAIKTDIKAPFPNFPTEFTLLPNYPNPFNPTTTIQYEVPSTGSVRIVVIDLMGREVAVLVDQIQPAGRYSLPFDANQLSSGVYLYRLPSGDFSQSRVLIVLK